MCHGRVKEGEKKKRKEGKAQEIELRNMFMTDCTSVEEFPPRHCREVAQNYITGRRHLKGEQGAFGYEGFQIFTVCGNRWA